MSASLLESANLDILSVDNQNHANDRDLINSGQPHSRQHDDISNDGQFVNDEKFTGPSTKRIHEIYHIAYLLRQKLVPDLIPSILNEAGIFFSTTTRVKFNPAIMVSQENAPRAILASKHVHARARVRQPVRKIVFQITAHDQGSARELSELDHGPWTWFTARSITNAQDCTPDQAATIRGCREVCRNPMADDEWHTLQVTWRADSEDLSEAAWVSSLSTGDQIIVDAWSANAGWMNHIQQASITVYTVAIS